MKSTAYQMRLHPLVNLLVKGDTIVLEMRNRYAFLTPNNEALHACVEMWWKGGTAESFQEKVEQDHPGQWSVIKPQFEQLVRDGFLEDMDAVRQLDPEDEHRWSRMLNFLARYEQEGTSRYEFLHKVRQAKVLVVGAGGMGSWVTSQLISLGVGHLVLIDEDRVELSNLNRTAMYKPSDIGKYKVDCAVEYAREFSPRTQVEGVRKLIKGPDDLAPHLEGVDLVIGCADAPVFYIRKWISEACLQANVAFLLTNNGRVGPLKVPSNDTACPMCEVTYRVDKHPNLLQTMDQQGHLQSGASASVVSNPAIVSGVVGFEALRYLSGYEPPVTLDAVWNFRMDMNFQVTPMHKHPHCISCSSRPAL